MIIIKVIGTNQVKDFFMGTNIIMYSEVEYVHSSVRSNPRRIS